MTERLPVVDLDGIKRILDPFNNAESIGCRDLTRFYFEERRRKDKKSLSPNGNPSIARILEEVALRDAIHAEVVKCWVERMPIDRCECEGVASKCNGKGRHLTGDLRLALEVAHLRGEAWLSDYSQRLLGIDMSIKQVGIFVRRGDNILRARYESRGLLAPAGENR